MKNIVKIMGITAILFSSTIFAQDEEHAEVGKRPLPPEKREELAMQMYDEVAIEDEESEEVAEFGPSDEAKCGLLDPVVYFPEYCHWMTARSVLCDYIDLEDGSKWFVSPYDRYKIKYWDADEPIMITQNTAWFSSQKFKLVNKNTGNSVEADLSLGPLIGGKFTHFIAGIDVAKGIIVLEDGSYWEIYSGDLYKTKIYGYEWILDDNVIIGVNSGYKSSYFGYILINVPTNEFVRVSPL